MSDSTGIFRLGDYEVKAFRLLSSTGATLDLYTAFSELKIFEDIYSASVSGYILITDSNDNFSTMDLHGSEFLYLKLDKPSLDEPYERYFRVYKIANKIVKNKNSTAYSIHFTTEDHFISNQYKISRAFSGPADVSVLSILKKDIKTSSNKIALRNFESPYGDLNLVIPYMNPFQAINFIASRTMNENGSFFLFYENFDGYNFKSLESILKGNVYKTYNFRPKTLEKANPADSFHSIDDITINQNYDTLTTMLNGGFAVAMKNVNILRRQFSVNNYNITNRAGYPTLGKGYPVNNYTNRKGDSVFTSFDAFTKYFVTTTANSDYDDQPNYSEKFAFRSMEHALLHNCRMTVSIPGDFLIKVGSIISLNLPKFAQSTKSEQDLDEFYSGSMLVMGVSHVITPTSHKTHLEIVKDSLAETLSGAANNSELEKAKNE